MEQRSSDFDESVLIDHNDAALDRLRFIPRMADRQRDRPGIGVTNRVMGEFELLWFRGGSGIVELPDERVKCGRGSLVMIRPWETHSIRSSIDDPHDNFWTHFLVEPDIAADAFAASFFPAGTRSAVIVEEGVVEYLWHRMLEEIVAKPPFYAQTGTALFTALVYRLWRITAGAPALAPPARSALLLSRIDAFIAEHLRQDINVERLSSAFSISRTTLFDLFRSERGLSPAAYIRKERLRAAALLLRTGNLSLKEIAARVGFSDQFSLSRSFKALYGSSPRDWLAGLAN